MTQLGDLMASARTRLSLDQDALAQRVGVQQQSVSRWERGQSRPRANSVAKLAATLGLSFDEINAAIDADFPAASAEDPSMPVRPLTATLPFDRLSPEQFEQFICDLFSALFPDASVTPLGGRGGKQHGYDVLVTCADGQTIGVQCKREQSFGPKKVDAAVAAATLSADSSVIALSRPATAAAVLAMRAHAGWELWGQEILSRKTRDLPKDVAVRLVDRYFPGHREAFLGVRAPGPWLSTDDFFREGPQILLDHRQAIQGRADDLEAIAAWLDDGSSLVNVVVGRGGLGKSKLLYDVCRRIEALGDEVVLLAPGAQPPAEAYELLPNPTRLLVVIDDAHLADNLTPVLSEIWRHRPQAKVLLASRPDGEGHVTNALMRLGHSASAIQRRVLDDLESDEVAALIEELTGQSRASLITRQLTAISADCPFLAVAGAKLLNDGRLTSATFGTSQDLRTDLLTLLADSTLDGGPPSERVERRHVLEAIAAYQPVRLGDPAFQEAMTKLSEITSWDMVSGRITELEDAGFVLRRGESVRVVPDMLGDVYLSRVAYDARSHLSTGYLGRALDSASGQPQVHLLINASRIDWQIRDAGQPRTDLVKPLWDVIETRLAQSSTIDEQIDALSVLEKVAFFQPQRALQLVRTALAAASQAGAAAEPTQPTIWARSRQDMLDAATRVLRNIAYNLEQVPDVLDALWALARVDTRGPSQYPDHPLRVISELAEIRDGKPFEYTQAVIDAAKRWLVDNTSTSRSPFDVLGSVLAVECSQETSSRLTLTFHTYALEPSAVLPLRQQVVDLAFDQATSDTVEAVRAVQFLGDAIRYPIGMFGRQPSDEERARWTPHFTAIIDRLGDLVADPDLDPVVRLAVREAIGWHADHSPTETKAAAQVALAKLPTTMIDDLALCLHDGWGRLGGWRDLDVEAMEARREQEFQRVAKTVLSGRSDSDVIDLVAGRLQKDRDAFKSDHGSGRFLWTLLASRPSVAKRLCERTIAGERGHLNDYSALALALLAESNDSDAISLATEMLDSGDESLARIAAQGIGLNRGRRSTLLDGETELLMRFVSDDLEYVRVAGARVVRFLAESHPGVAMKLLQAIRIDGSTAVAEQTMSSFFPPGGLRWAQVDAPLRGSITEQLIICPSLDEYPIMGALADLSAFDPILVTEILLVRIECAEADEVSVLDYHAIPYRWEPPLRIRDTKEFVRCLNEVAAWMAKGERTYVGRHLGGRLFAAIAAGWDQQTVAVLTASVATADRETLVVLAEVLKQAPDQFLFDQRNLVSAMLQRASSFDQDAINAVSGELLAGLATGSRSGTPGQPFPIDVKQRERAAEIASTLPRGSAEFRFWNAVERAAQERISWTIERDDRLDGRDW